MEEKKGAIAERCPAEGLYSKRDGPEKRPGSRLNFETSPKRSSVRARVHSVSFVNRSE
jgi:hypothetical protein